MMIKRTPQPILRWLASALAFSALTSLAAVTAGTNGRVSAQATDEADTVVEKHLAALGGRAALGKLTSRRSTGTITLAISAGELSGPLEVINKAPNKARARMELDLSALGMPQKMVVEQKFDGTAAWTLNSLEGDSEITGDQLQSFRNNIFPSALLNYKSAGTKIEVVPAEPINGKAMILLRLTPKAGAVVRMYLDAETSLMFRTMTKVTLPAGVEVEQVAEFSDYRVVDGVKVPHLVVNSNPQQTATLRLSKVEHNVAIDDAVFSKGPAPELLPRR